MISLDCFRQKTKKLYNMVAICLGAVCAMEWDLYAGGFSGDAVLAFAEGSHLPGAVSPSFDVF